MTTKDSNFSITNVRNELSFTQQDTDLAVWMGLDLSRPAPERAEQAMCAYNAATRSMVEAGLLLSSIKQEMSQDAFMAMLEERGLPFPRAYELMRGAALAARIPEEQRTKVLAMSKTKVMALASASPAVVEALLEGGEEVDVDLMSVRAMKARIKDLEAAAADLAVQRDRADAEAAAARKRLERGSRLDGLPLTVADIRAEIGALTKKADLAVESMTAVGQDLGMLIGVEGAGAWVDGTARMGLAALAALRLQIDGQIERWNSLLPEGEADPFPDGTSYMTKEEVRELAQSWQQITAEHQHEQALREWEAEQAAPKKGRPRAKPEAPKA